MLRSKASSTAATDVPSAAFASSLKGRLQQIQSQRQREEALDRMRQVLDSYAEFRDSKRGRH